MGRDKVLQHGHTFLKVRKDGVFNRRTGVGTCLLGLRHQTTHTSELSNLIGATTSTRVEHHEDCVETLVGFGHLLHEGALDVAVHLGPSVDNLVVTLVVGDETHTIVTHDLLDAVVTSLHDFSLFLRNDDIVEVERKTTFVCLAITEVFDAIEEFASAGHTNALDDLGDDVAERLLRDDGINKTDFARNDFVDNDTTYRSFHQVTDGETILIDVVYQHFDRCVHRNLAFVVGDDGFFRSVEGETSALRTRTELRDVVETEHHVLRGHCDRCTVGRVEDVVALEHEHL